MDPYLRACREFEKARIPYLIVGAFGANLYAREVGTVVSTLDCDLLLPADPVVLGRAVRVLRKLRYRLEAGGEPVNSDPDLLRGIVRAGALVRALKMSVQIDLPMSIAGCRFAPLWKKQRRLKVGGVLLRVAPLRDILRSKKLADRPKDRLFLATYEDALRQLLRPASKRRPS